MDTIFSTVLVTAPVAFMVGWLLAKVLFRHISIVRPAAVSGGALAEAAQPRQLNSLAAANDGEFRKLLKLQQARIVDREQRIAELEGNLAAADQRTARLATIFRRWRGRTRPLARQYRQQRVIIKELREELRLRDAADQPPSSPVDGRPAAPVAGPQVANSNLQSLHGVGPALQIRLKDLGIYNLSQFAEMSRDDLSKLHAELGLGRRRAGKYDWIAQARRNLGLPSANAAKTADQTVASGSAA